jgi:hypothetical protein
VQYEAKPIARSPSRRSVKNRRQTRPSLTDDSKLYLSSHSFKRRHDPARLSTEVQAADKAQARLSNSSIMSNITQSVDETESASPGDPSPSDGLLSNAPSNNMLSAASANHLMRKRSIKAKLQSHIRKGEVLVVPPARRSMTVPIALNLSDEPNTSLPEVDEASNETSTHSEPSKAASAPGKVAATSAQLEPTKQPKVLPALAAVAADLEFTRSRSADTAGAHAQVKQQDAGSKFARMVTAPALHSILKKRSESPNSNSQTEIFIDLVPSMTSPKDPSFTAYVPTPIPRTPLDNACTQPDARQLSDDDSGDSPFTRTTSRHGKSRVAGLKTRSKVFFVDYLAFLFMQVRISFSNK